MAITQESSYIFNKVSTLQASYRQAAGLESYEQSHGMVRRLIYYVQLKSIAMQSKVS